MDKRSLSFLIILLLGTSFSPVFALMRNVHDPSSDKLRPANLTDAGSFILVNSGIRTEYYKDSSGYDRVLRPDGSVIVASQRYTVEYLSGKNWKQIGIPYEVVSEELDDETRITRRYTDSLGTEIEVIYHAYSNAPTKMDVVIHSGATRNYRIVWNLDGIDNTVVSHGDNFINFTGTSDWVAFDWNDAFDQYGDITNFEVTDSANGKKLDVIFSVGTVPEGETFTLDPTLIDSYGTGNQDATHVIDDNHPASGANNSAVGQIFTASSTFNISTAKFYLSKTGSPTGNAAVALYAVAGSVPTGSALTTSNVFDISTLTGSLALVTFDFAGVTPYELQSSTEYAIVFQAPASGTIAGPNYVSIGYDDTGVHAGDLVRYVSGGWSWSSGDDTIFYIYGNEAPVNDAVVSTSTIPLDTPGWINVTVTEPDLVADLKTVDILVNTSGNAETFTLRWTQSSGVFSEVSDSDNILSLDVAGSVRVNVDNITDTLAFLFNMTGGTDGLADVTVTTTDDSDLTDVDVFANEFTFQTYPWGAVGQLLSSAGSLFGVDGVIDLLVAYFTGIYVYLTSSFTNMLTLITQIFIVIDGTFTFTVDWLTRVISLLVSIFTIVTSLLNGSHAILTDAINVWSTMNFGEWGVTFVPILIFVYWMESLDKRGKVQGWNSVFMGDISTVINILSFFVTMFSLIINTAIQAAWSFVNMIQSVP